VPNVVESREGWKLYIVTGSAMDGKSKVFIPFSQQKWLLACASMLLCNYAALPVLFLFISSVNECKTTRAVS
jgi:hypothetical protein